MIGVFPTKHAESLPLNGFSSFFIYNCRTSAAFLIGVNKAMNQGLEPKQIGYVYVFPVRE